MGQGNREDQGLRAFSRSLLWVVGFMRPGQGWEVVSEQTEGACCVEVTVRIEEVTGGFLVMIESTDGSVYADEWVETLQDAKALALEAYGIDRWDQ